MTQKDFIMMMQKCWTSSIFAFFTFLCAASMLHGQTIAEKKAGYIAGGGDLNPEMQKFLYDFNHEMVDWEAELHRLYGQVQELYRQHAPVESYKDLLEKINEIKGNIQLLQESWREMSAQSNQEEGYALWHQPETTLGQLIMDYGSQEYVYLVSPEIATIKLSVDSNLPIPRSSWDEMLELILVQNGVGVKQLNPYLRQLFLITQDKSNLRLITNKRQDLEIYPVDTRICFVLTPEPAEVRRVWAFLDKFVNPNSTVLQMVGRDILIIGSVGEIQELLKLYDFISTNKGDKEYKVVPLFRVEADEMSKVLGAIFDQMADKQVIQEGPPKLQATSKGIQLKSGSKPKVEVTDTSYNGLRVIALGKVAQALFLIGTKEEIKKAEEIIYEVENQVGGAREKVIYWYTVKNSNADELADVLYRIYALMIQTGVGAEQSPEEPRFPENPLELPPPPLPGTPGELMVYPPQRLYDQGYYVEGRYVVNRLPITPGTIKKPEYNKDRNNFIVDPKTGSIAMVVEADILPKIKELIRKMDVPKKMVQVEVLLFEKIFNTDVNYGLNLLRIGNCASNRHFTCYDWNDVGTRADPHPENAGLFQFIISRMKHSGIPAFDLAYNFLLKRDDIQINSNPSLITVNQTPATINILDEITINTGVFQVETAKGVTLEDAFARAQYGITLVITPTIHMNESDNPLDDEPNYITLETDIDFETIQPSDNPQQPNVSIRHITNQVVIPDGQSVILGGLRRKVAEDFKEAIPFLGELPCLGKLFSINQMSDKSTEMYICLTPRIISDPIEDIERMKCIEVTRRPGDIPLYLCRVEEAFEWEKHRLMALSMEILCGPPPDRCTDPYGEYDGRCR